MWYIFTEQLAWYIRIIYIYVDMLNDQNESVSDWLVQRLNKLVT